MPFVHLRCTWFEFRKLVRYSDWNCCVLPSIQNNFILWMSSIPHANVAMPLEIYFIYLGKKELYCTFKICGTICVLFSKNVIYFTIQIFFIQIISASFIKEIWTYKYVPLSLKFISSACFFHYSPINSSLITILPFLTEYYIVIMEF